MPVPEVHPYVGDEFLHRFPELVRTRVERKTPFLRTQLEALLESSVGI